jgi:hypothetical protein
MIDNVSNTISAATTAADSSGKVLRRALSGGATAREEGSVAPNFAALFGAAAQAGKTSSTTNATATPARQTTNAVTSSAAGASATATSASSSGIVQQRTLFGDEAVTGNQYVVPNFAALFGPAAAASTSTTGVASTAAIQAANVTAAATTATATTTAATTASAASAVTLATPGIEALVSAIMDGSFQGGNVTDPSKLQQVSPWGSSATLTSFFYASDQTANQLAQLLGGKVVQMPAFGQGAGWTEPMANFIELPNGQKVNAASLAYYANCGVEGKTQLTADLTQDINEGAAMSNFYQNGGDMPSFGIGYTGPAISGMAYPAGTVAADGTVINPAMQSSATQGTQS